MTIIVDGTGTGKKAKVDITNRLFTDSVSKSTEHVANVDFGTAWAIPFQITPSAGGTFFYLKNTGSDNIIIEGLETSVAATETLLVRLNDTGTPGGGTDLTPANLNTSFNTALPATVQSGAALTGLSDGRLVKRVVRTSLATEYFNFEADVCVGPSGVFTLEAVTGSIALTINLIAYIEQGITS